MRKFSLEPVLLLCLVKRRNCFEMLKQSRPKCINSKFKDYHKPMQVGVCFLGVFLWSTCMSGLNSSCILRSCSFCHYWCHAEAEGCAWVHWAGTAYSYKQTWDLLKEMPAWQYHHLEFRRDVHLCLTDNVITFITFLAESTCAQPETSAQGNHFDWGDINSSH